MMIRSTCAALLFVAVVAGPAVAESPPPAPAETPADQVDDVPPPPVVEAAPAVDAFGLPCEVTFAPRPAGKATRGKRGHGLTTTAPSPSRYTTRGLDHGADFMLGRPDRGPSYKPTAEAEVRMQAATVTASMVGMVVRENASALEFCMTRMAPAARRGTIGLVLTIEPTGKVSAARITGAPRSPAFTACLAAAATTWQMPHGDASVVIEYPIVLNAR
jgi:hypothetical protein